GRARRRSGRHLPGKKNLGSGARTGSALPESQRPFGNAHAYWWIGNRRYDRVLPGLRCQPAAGVDGRIHCHLRGCAGRANSLFRSVLSLCISRFGGTGPPASAGAARPAAAARSGDETRRRDGRGIVHEAGSSRGCGIHAHVHLFLSRRFWAHNARVRMRLLGAAIAFLTRVPVTVKVPFDTADVGRSTRWYPLIGAMIGGVYAEMQQLFSSWLPPLVVAVLIVVAEALLTGALHMDALADAADGLGGGWRREDVLRIMRD